jgi:hypothetical protein
MTTTLAGCACPDFAGDVIAITLHKATLQTLDGTMIKRIREVQPAHKSARITVAQAARAFRQVRGSNPKPDIFDEPGAELVRRDSAAGRFVRAAAPAAPIAAEKADPGSRGSSRTRKR